MICEDLSVHLCLGIETCIGNDSSKRNVTLFSQIVSNIYRLKALQCTALESKCNHLEMVSML